MLRSCFLFLLALFPLQASANTPKACSALAKQKKFLDASTCYQKLADAMPPNTKLSKIQRLLKGRYLTNAATSYEEAAKQEKNSEAAAYLREQAAGLLQRYLKDNLCQKLYLCRLARGRLLEINTKIGYGTLSIATTPNQPATIEITGFKFQASHNAPPAWTQKVRPGAYTLKVTYKGKTPLTRQATIAPKQNLTVTILKPAPKQVKRRTPPKRRITPVRRPRRPPPPKPKPASPVPWIIAGVGGAAALAGGAILIFGQMQLSQSNTLAKELSDQATQAKAQSDEELQKLAASEDTKKKATQATELDQSARTLLPVGWIVLGAGVAIGVTGVILALVMRPTPQKTASIPPTRQHTRTSLYQSP